MQNLATAAYQRTSQTTANPRELEAMLLMRAAAQLQAVQDDWNASSFEDIKEALTYNRRLWTVLVTSATEDSNPLPIELKQNIGSLGVFILRHTVRSEERRVGKERRT